MKFILLLLLFVQPTWSMTFQVIGPCSDQPLFKIQTESGDSTLGDLSLKIFKQFQIPYVGDRSGIHSIWNSPVGDEALEVLSNEAMRAYGWCVSVDGVPPDFMPDEVLLSSQTKEVTWFYAFTFYDRGVWKDQCTPSYRIQSPQICKGSQAHK